MSTLWYKGLCQVEALAARTDGSASELCADNDWKNNIHLTTTCERFISHVKPTGL